MTIEGDSSRREFLGVLAQALRRQARLPLREAAAQGAAPLQIVDFHNHYMGPSWTLTNLAGVPPAARPTWERINGNLQSPGALLASVEAAGIAARVINTPTAFIEDADGNVAAGAIQRINDEMAEIRRQARWQALRPRDGRCLRGDAGARELTRAVKELGLRGVFLESAKGDLLLGAKETRPTLLPRRRWACRCSCIR